MKAVIIISLIVLGIMVFISALSGMFDFWGFFAIIFYLALYIGGWLYVRIGSENRKEESDTTIQRFKKFDYCWERVSKIMKSMPGGQGIEWASGFGRRSTLKSYFDGIQNKPFRSIIAHLEYSQQLVLIIYDIDGDDISEFIANPDPELINNPFLYFKPFTRGVEGNAGMDRFGGMGNYNPSLRYPHRTPYPRRRGGISINVGDGFGDFDAENNPNPKLVPESQVVDNAFGKLRK